MARYNKQMACKIAELIEEGIYTTTDICKIAGIGRKTFYRWKEKHSDFSKALQEAEYHRSEDLRLLAQQTLRHKLEGYMQRVERTVYIPSADDPSQLVIKQHVVTEKFCEPDTRLILQLLENGNEKTGQKQPAPSTPFAVKVDEEKAKKDLNTLDSECIATVEKEDNESPKKEADLLDEEDVEENEDNDTERKHKTNMDANECEEKEREESITERQHRLLNEYMKKHESIFVPPPLRGIAYKLNLKESGKKH